VEWVETTGRTVADALEAALDQLGVDEQDAEVHVLVEPRAGVFGIGRTDARIRARVRPSAPRPKRPQRGRRSRDQRSSGQGREDTREPSGAGQGRERRPTSQPAKSRSRPSGTKRAGPSEGAGTAPPSTVLEGVGDGSSAGSGAHEAGVGSSASRRRRGGRRGHGGREGAPTGAPRNEEGEMGIEQQAELVGAFVRGVVERLGYEATTDVRVEEEHIVVEVTGDDLGLLIGPRGSTLDSLQELARTVVQRRGDEHGARVVVDVAGFRAKRAAALENFVRRLAAEVLASGEPEALEPMSPADRKIVHDTVNGIVGVETTSEGVEPSRYVVIRPSSAGAAPTAPIEAVAAEAGTPDD